MSRSIRRDMRAHNKVCRERRWVWEVREGLKQKLVSETHPQEPTSRKKAGVIDLKNAETRHERGIAIMFEGVYILYVKFKGDS